MTREEAKKLLPFIKAYSEGKTIQSRCVTDIISPWLDNNNPTFDADTFDYRIKPEPKYRPFKNANECWKEMQKHNPFGWIKVKNSNCYKFLAAVQNIGIYTVAKCSYETGFKNFTFADGTPFGILEEE